MINPLQALGNNPLGQVDPTQATGAGAAAPARSFSDTLTQALKTVNDTQLESDSMLKDLAAGKNVDLHGTMISLEKADISLRTMVSVRDKMVSAYEQIMNMTL